jgi:hypothetical protein
MAGRTDLLLAREVEGLRLKVLELAAVVAEPPAGDLAAAVAKPE